jgi:F420-0:gamma-glutamyl ligase-like protein
MLDDPILHYLAEETLDLLKPVAIVYHDPHAVARMLADDLRVRERTLRTLERMDVTDLRKHKDVLERTIRRRCGLCTTTEEALLQRINAESSVQLI